MAKYCAIMPAMALRHMVLIFGQMTLKCTFEETGNVVYIYSMCVIMCSFIFNYFVIFRTHWRCVWRHLGHRG